MSFFGQSNNQQSSGFGGFGANNTSSTGFGQPSNTGFGASTGNTGGSLFGASNNNTTNTGFGGFGATGSTSAPFGGTTAFGANSTSGGGMFGSNTATAGSSTGFGGFGGNNANTGGSLFGGGNKPAFGSQQPSTGGSLFGGGSNAFGASNNQSSSTFGAAPPSSALASNTAECQGTGSTPFSAWPEKEGLNGNQTNHYQSITFMQPYKNFSFEVGRRKSMFESPILKSNDQELRLADYNQGRRYGNGNGQAGAFGTSTGFGGFGGQNTSGGFGSNTQSSSLFGAQTTSASPFGGAQTATSGFGANNTSGGGLFGGGAAKTSGFGTTTSQPSGGGLFGGGNQSGGFGTQNNTNTNSGTGFGTNQGGGLFGANNQQKSGFSFGQNNNTGTGTGFGTSGNSGFGSNNNNTSTGGGLFGTNTTSAPFGGQQQAASNPFGGFGNNQQSQTQPQNATAPAFGGFGSNNQQQKSGGLFGTDNSTTNTGGGLFGSNNQNNQQPAPGGLFGNNNNQTGGSSLFGPKPAATGTGLFGNANTSNSGNTGGGLFGTNTNQNQPSQSGGLFGNTNQQQQKPGGLFGGGNSLFGNSNTNNQQQGSGSSLFGGLGSNNPQQQSGGLFGNSNNNNTSSLFNNSQPQQQQQQQQSQNNPLSAPQAYTASIFDSNPYGNRSIFDGLPPPPQQYTGPIATPIGQKGQAKKPAILPQYRINPHVASRFVTPQKRQGYGFTYSTYGTPSSANSNVSTPGGLGSSLLQGSISRGLGKSLSTTNLRRSFDTDGESLLSPNAFSAGSSRYNGTGSLKKLTIDRSLRTDLFSGPPPLPSSDRGDQSRQPGILKKKVSFDASTVGGNGDTPNGGQVNGVNGNSGSSPESANPQTSEQGPSGSNQPNGLQNGQRENNVSAQPEMEQVKGNELAVINEDGNQDMQGSDGSRKASQPSQYDPQPGAYYMKPSLQEVAKMSFEQKKRVPDVCIGREDCGFVIFDRPVNLNEVPMDRLFGDIAQIDLRSLTIYPDAASKPSVGKGLNVPSTIHLTNSWPRAKDRQTPLYEKSGKRFNLHLERLRRVRDTTFVSYDKDTGVWVFKVDHFTTYGLDYEDEGSEGETFQTSPLSAPSDSPTRQSHLPRAGSTPMPSGSFQDSSMLSSEWSQDSTIPDDTFEFRRKKILPGAFDDAAVIDETQDQHTEMTDANGSNGSFLDERSAASGSDDGEPSNNLSDTNYLNRNQSLIVREEHPDMAGSFPEVVGRVDQENAISPFKDSQAANIFGTPTKLEFNNEGNWAEELRRTISPRKQDRQALRESQARVLERQTDRSGSTPKASMKRHNIEPDFTTSMDVMNFLYQKQPERREKGKQGTVGQGKAFQV
ncbi:MAG: hypothetical protein Q9224_002798 [Gallowayella concinna]